MTANTWVSNFLEDLQNGIFSWRSGGALSVTTVTSTTSVTSPTHIVGTATGPQILSGTGSPSGAVTAPAGSIFIRTDGAGGSRVYVNQNSGTTWTAIATV